jgi:hypothetical protein
MLKLLIAGVVALALPSLASAQPGCLEQRHDNRVAGTVAVAGLGAVIGGASTACGGFTQVGDYDANGVWRAGPGYHGANGVWRQAGGYYDGDGDWVDAAPPPASHPAPAPPSAGDHGADVAYTSSPDDLASREAWLGDRIHEGESSGAMSHEDAAHDFDTLANIRQTQAHGGDVARKLDDLADSVHAQWRY